MYLFDFTLDVISFQSGDEAMVFSSRVSSVGTNTILWKLGGRKNKPKLPGNVWNWNLLLSWAEKIPTKKSKPPFPPKAHANDSRELCIFSLQETNKTY